MTGSTAALASFEESSALLHELAGVEVSAKQVERAAEALGAEIADDERRCVERMGEVAPTMYLGMDGTGVPMRAAEVAGRAGKQLDGSAKTREAKVVAMWTAESRDAENKPVRDLGSITYSAAIESAATSDTCPDRSDFAERVLREATRRGFTEAFSLRGVGRRALPGSGTPPGNCSRKPLRFSTGSTPRKLCTEPGNLSSAQPAKAKPGQRSNARNWMLVDYTELSPRFAPKPLPRPRRPNARSTSFAIALGCATRSFMPRASVRPPESLRLAAKWRSGPGSNELACTGASMAQTPSSRCAAQSSADVMKTFGSVAGTAWRSCLIASPKSDVHPLNHPRWRVPS
jgi:hypothetical protein